MWKFIKLVVEYRVEIIFVILLVTFIWVVLQGCIKYVEIPVPDNQWQKFIAAKGQPPNTLAIFMEEKINGAYVIFYKESCIDDKLVKAHEKSHGIEKEKGWPYHSIYPEIVHVSEITQPGCVSVKTTAK